jgi:hypothetical protein
MIGELFNIKYIEMKLDMLFQLTGRNRLREIAKIIVGYKQGFVSHIGNIFDKNYKKIVKSSLIML